MRQSCRIVNDQVFGHVCGGDHGHVGRANESRATPRGPQRTVRAFGGAAPRGGPYGPPGPRRVCRRPPPCGMCPANRCRGTGHHERRASPSHREDAGNHLVGGMVPRDARSGRTWASGRDRPRIPHVPARAPRRGACRTTTRAPPETACTPATGTRRSGPASGGEPVHPFPEKAAGPAVPQGCRATWLRDTGTTGHGPICRPRAADLAVPDEEVWQPGNWPESTATCLRCPWCRCGRSCGCRGSCRRRGCWSGRHSR